MLLFVISEIFSFVKHKDLSIIIFFFLIISSCSSKFSFYESEGFASVSKQNIIITSLPKGTLLKITNHENKNSKIIKTDEKSNTLGSRIILLPIEIYKKLNLDKKNLIFSIDKIIKNEIATTFSHRHAIRCRSCHCHSRYLII